MVLLLVMPVVQMLLLSKERCWNKGSNLADLFALIFRCSSVF